MMMNPNAKLKPGYYRDAPCDDCLEPIGYDVYMLHDKLWLSVAKKGENLCISCLEKRLGRKVTQNDFSEQWCLNFVWGWIPLSEAMDPHLLTVYLQFFETLEGPPPPRFVEINPDWEKTLKTWLPDFFVRLQREKNPAQRRKMQGFFLEGEFYRDHNGKTARCNRDTVGLV